jgi:CheY-like chemotaxis protein
MDMKMPLLNGYEATMCPKADEQTRHIPVIALTASAMKGDEEDITEISDGYLRKPISLIRLIEKLARYLKFSQR